MMSTRAIAAAVMFSWALSACLDPVTEVVITVSVEGLRVPTDIDTIGITVHDSAADVDTYVSPSLPLCYAGGPSSCLALPISVALVPGPAHPLDPVDVEVTGQSQGNTLTRDAASFTFVTNYSVHIPIVLYQACLGSVFCPDNPVLRTCGSNGQCSAPGVVVDGNADLAIDVADAGSRDASTPRDAAASDSGSSDAASSLVDAALPDLRPVLRRVFLSRKVTTGAFGSVAAMDSACQSDAMAAQLGGGPYYAVVATSTSAANANFPVAGAAIYTPNGLLVATNGTSFFSAAHQNEILELADGSPPNSYGAWTGMATSAGDHGSACDNWTVSTSSVFGLVGDATYTDTQWFDQGAVSCNSSYSVYCLGVN